MPVTLSGIIASTLGTSALGVALQTGLGALTIIGGTAIGGAIINLGLSLGLSYLSHSLFAPSAPKPEDVQQSTRQPTQPRVRHYGRVKVSGPWVFAESEKGNFHKVIAIAQGQIDAIEEYWVDDSKVELDSNGVITTEPWTNSDGSNLSEIHTRLGLDTETPYTGLTSTFADWTSDHRGDGVASLYAMQHAAKQERYLKLFPNGINTNYRLVIRGAIIENPLTGTAEWNDNAAAVIRDYITHEDGMRLPSSIVSTTLAQAGWETAYNRAAELYDLKAGGTEARYRLWGSYSLAERPADVIGRMMASCDARLVPTSDGGLTLDIGDWAEPTVTIDADTITGFSEVGRGRDILSTANTIRATYLAPDQDYQAGDADPWVDADDVSERGEIAQDLGFNMAPSHSQARRLMKLAAYRANPSWVGQFQCNLKALAAMGERFVRIKYPLFGINEVLEVQDFRFVMGEGGILVGVTLQVQSMPSEAYDWDADQEEGDAPVYDESEDNTEIPLPTDDGREFNVTIQRKTISGQLVPYALLTFDEPPSDALSIDAQGKRTADTQWTPIGVSSGATSAESFVLSDGEEYEFQIRYSTINGSKGDWTESVVITAIGDPNAPDPVSEVTATGGTGTVDISWTAPNSQNYAAACIYRNTTDDEENATLVRTEYGPQSNMDSWQDSGLAAGTYYYWITARNASGIESTSVATGAVTVT